MSHRTAKRQRFYARTREWRAKESVLRPFRRALHDTIVHGMGWMRGLERIDPRAVWK